MQLRDYQVDAVAAVERDWRTHTDVLGVAATGAGKTQILLALMMQALDADPNARALILAHRKTLIDQPIERLRQMDAAWLRRGPGHRPRVGMVRAERDECDRQLTVATVQTLAPRRAGERQVRMGDVVDWKPDQIVLETPRDRVDDEAFVTTRLDRVLAHGPITHLIIDEAHHAVADSYRRIVQVLRQHNPAMRHLGVTATPFRADEDGLARVYQATSFKITIADLVKQHYLVQPRWLAIATGISMRGVKAGKDFTDNDVAERYDTPRGRAIVVQAYQQYATGRRAIAFVANVAAAYALAEAFTAAGVHAACIEGNTPEAERERLIAAFRAHQLDVLCSVDVLTEGFDAPGASCVLMCRPTKSDGRYVQAMGRGLRPAGHDPSRPGMAVPGEDCLILDFVPAETRNIVMAGDVLGLPKETTRQVLKLQQAEPGAVQAGFTFDGESFDSSGTPLEIIARTLHYLETSVFRWHQRDGWMTLGLGKASDGNERILAIPPGEPLTLYGMVRAGTPGAAWRSRVLATGDMDALATEAEAWAARRGSGTLTQKARTWHTQPISEGQQQFLRRLARGALKGRDIEQLDRGTAASLINHFLAVRYLDRGVAIPETSGALAEVGE